MDQTVTEDATLTETTPQAVEEEGSTGPDAPDLDTLLSEFDEGTTKPQETQPASDDVSKQLETLANEVKAIRSAEQSRNTETAVEQTVANVKAASEFLKDFPSETVEAHIYRKAEKDSRFATAFMNRGSNPAAWKNVERAMAKEIEQLHSSVPNKDLTGDREAAQAAVSGMASTMPSDGLTDKEKLNMSPAEMRQWKDANG